MGILADATISQSAAFTMQPGQTLLLLSDGIVESHSRDGEPFGLTRVLETVQAQEGKSAQAVVAAIYQAACHYRGNAAQEDDMTFVIVRAN